MTPPTNYDTVPAQIDAASKNNLVIARPQAVAISCASVQVFTPYQEIATSLRPSQ